MNEIVMNDWIWWVTIIEIPAMAGLLAMFLKLRDAQVSDKVEALRSFAGIRDVQEIEKRLVSHLLRIEAKLDVTALKTEGLLRNGGAS